MVIKIKTVVKEKIPKEKRHEGYRRELLGAMFLREEKTIQVTIKMGEQEWCHYNNQEETVSGKRLLSAYSNGKGA